MQWLIRRSFAEFFRDLLAGDPVALTLVGLFLGFLLVLGVLALLILRGKWKRDEAFRQRRQRKEKEEREASRKIKDHKK